MQSQTKPTRSTYWDTVKALLIFLVILGHVVQYFMYVSNSNEGFWSDPVFKGIYMFHMPLFMLVSGYFAAKSIAKHGQQAVTRYLKRLALPCVGMGGVLILLKGVLDGCATLWFLIVVFECVVFYTIMQWKQAWWHKSIMFILPIPLAILCGRTPYISMLWPHTYQFTYLWPVFVLGAFMAHLKFTPQHINWKWILFPALYIIAFYFFQPDWYVYRKPLTFDIDCLLIDIYRTAAAIVGCGTVLWASKHIHSFIGKYAIVQKVGQTTLAIYVLQSLFFLYFQLFAQYLPQSLGYPEAILLSLVILGALYLIYLTTKHIPLVALLMYGEWSRKENKN